jgi:hypothetical protein
MKIVGMRVFGAMSKRSELEGRVFVLQKVQPAPARRPTAINPITVMRES